MFSKDIAKRVAISALVALVLLPFSYVLRRALGVWGVLDPLADFLGNWLKIHVEPDFAGWTIAVIASLALYGLFLWKVWRPRHIHHLPITAVTAPVPSVSMKVTRAAPRISDMALEGMGEDIALPEGITPAVILAECSGKTAIQCEGATSVYMGQRLAVSGTLYAATRSLGSATTVSIDLAGVDRGNAFMTFEGDRERLGVLKPGDELSATGRLIEATSTGLKLVDCRLV